MFDNSPPFVSTAQLTRLRAALAAALAELDAVLPPAVSTSPAALTTNPSGVSSGLSSTVMGGVADWFWGLVLQWRSKVSLNTLEHAISRLDESTERLIVAVNDKKAQDAVLLDTEGKMLTQLTRIGDQNDKIIALLTKLAPDDVVGIKITPGTPTTQGS